MIAESQDGTEDNRKSSYDDIVERVKKNKKRVKKLRNRMSQRYIGACVMWTPWEPPMRSTLIVEVS